MNLTLDNKYENVENRTTSRYTIISIFTISLLSISIFYMTRELFYSLLLFSTIMLVIAFISADDWNKELKEDGYAPAYRIHGFYVGMTFYFFILLFIFSLEFPLRFSFATCINITLILLFLLLYVSFRNIEDDNIIKSRKEYTGPQVYYLKNSDYVEHIENIAEEKSDTEK